MSNHYIQMSLNQNSRSTEMDQQSPVLKMNSEFDSGPQLFNFRKKRLHSFQISWERILLILIFLITLILLFLLILLLCFTTKDGRKVNESDNLCLTISCLQAVVDIKKSLNTSVDPCIDFSQFACGKWQSNQMLPKGSAKYSTFDVVNSDLLKIQKKLLENPIFNINGTIYSKAVKLYKSCLNVEKINFLGSNPLHMYLNKAYGEWEMLPNISANLLDSWNFHKVIEDPNIEPVIFRIAVQEDEKNSSRNVFVLQLAGLLLDRQFLQNETKSENKKIINSYKEYMYEIGKLLKLNESKFDQFEEIIKLETEIAKKFPKEEETRDPDINYNKIKLSSLQRAYCQQFNWSEIFRKRLNIINVSLTEDIEIIVSNPTNLGSICEIFRNYSSKKRILHNYIIWRAVTQKVDLLSEDFQRVRERFLQIYYGSSGNKERWDQCITVVQNHMSLILGNMYIKNNFNKQSKPQVLEMINLLKEKFNDNLITNSWMDSATKHQAMKKIHAMWPLIGYTDSILNLTYLNELYKDVEINDEEYFNNINILIDRGVYINMKKIISKPTNSTIDTPQEVNAFYGPNKNEIIFPAGILQSPFFDPGFPRSLKYGGIGTAMGHEIIHGFDDMGSKYDFRGQLRLWWTNETRKHFKDKSDCFVKQYSTYSIHGHSINGENTLGENMADNGGMRLTYQVYKDLQKKYGKEKSLPGLEYTHDQLFFITFARLWCNLETKQSAIIDIMSNTHTPNRYRIIGTLSNFEEFSEAFNCPLDSPMNPSKKCMVW